MSHQLKIGHAGSAPVSIDLEKFVGSRGLIVGNSGSGKSYLARLICEQAAPLVQIIILDPEGEFATLREKFDFLLAGNNGEVPAEPRSAALLARRLVELKVSAVVDLSDLRLDERRLFVRLFLESLGNLPQKLWSPLLLLIDEAHLFCPEASAGKAESRDAVISLMSQGRKRSHCGVLITQRFSKLDKDAEAEANNVWVGKCWMDLDQKRAIGLLGIETKEKAMLRDMPAGRFYCFGPAMSTGGVFQFQAGTVKTTHPEPGRRHLIEPPKPSNAVRKFAGELHDLAKMADEEAKTLVDAQKQIAALKKELSAKPKPAAMIDQSAIDKAVKAAIDKRDREWQSTVKDRNRIIDDLTVRMGKAEKLLHVNGEAKPKVEPPAASPRPAVREDFRPTWTRPISIARERDESTSDIPKGEAAILSALIQYPDGLDRSQLTVLTGYKRSSRDAYIARLQQKGYVASSGGTVIATDEGRSALPDAKELPTGEELQEFWRNRLPSGERVILDRLIEAHPEYVQRDALSESTDYKRSSRDAYIVRLKAKQLIETSSAGVKASDNLF